MSAINRLLIEELEHRIIHCGIHRIIMCLDQLDGDQIHYRPNDNSNSINNQILHLNGNVRQWLISSILTTEDRRNRPAEFDPSNKKDKNSLINILKQLETDIRRVYENVENLDLEEKQTVQCYKETNLSILIHVIEHFSYHVGQITYITKMLLDIDTGYYAGQDLNTTKN